MKDEVENQLPVFLKKLGLGSINCAEEQSSMNEGGSEQLVQIPEGIIQQTSTS